jgi:magnesium transporter
MAETKFFHFTKSDLYYSVGTVPEALEAVKEGGFIWYNYYDPSREEINALVDLIGIHPLSVEDCFDDKQVPKIEYFPNNTFILFNSINYIDKELVFDEINLFLGQNFLITISGHNSNSRKPLNNIEGLLDIGSSHPKEGPEFLMHLILDYLVDLKYDAFDAMEDELELAEEQLLADVEKFKPVDLIHLRKDLLKLRKSLYHEREILVKICRKDCPFISDKAILQYRDIYDHLSKFFELTETYREIETSLMELYTSLLNNLMTKMSNDTNNSVRRLTLIATIFMPLTLLASIGGMSEWSMMTGPEKWKISYPLFILGMFVIAALNYYVLKLMEKRRNSREGKI